MDLTALLALVSPLAVLAAAFVAVGVIRAQVQDHARRISMVEQALDNERKDRAEGDERLGSRVRSAERWIDRRRGEAAARDSRHRSRPSAASIHGTGEYPSPDDS